MNDALKPIDDYPIQVKKSQSFRTKIIAITFLSVLVGLIFSVALHHLI